MTLDERVARLEDVEKQNAETRRVVSVLEERLLGQKCADFDVTGEREPGSLDKLEQLYDASINGGVPAKLSPEEREFLATQGRARLDSKTKIWVAVIGGLALVGSGVVGLITAALVAGGGGG